MSAKYKYSPWSKASNSPQSSGASIKLLLHALSVQFTQSIFACMEAP